MSWKVKVEQDEDGSMIVPLPDELLAQLGVGIGDTLHLVEVVGWDGPHLVLSKTPTIPSRVDALVAQWEREAVDQPEQDVTRNDGSAPRNTR